MVALLVVASVPFGDTARLITVTASAHEPVRQRHKYCAVTCLALFFSLVVLL